jgi:hypothetical protein
MYQRGTRSPINAERLCNQTYRVVEWLFKGTVGAIALREYSQFQDYHMLLYLRHALENCYRQDNTFWTQT